MPFARNDRARIVAIGDSFTFGQCVGDEETFPAEMERVLVDTDVVNLGVMGYGHDQALLRLRRDGLPYRPDAVLFGFHSTDVARNGLSFFSYAKPRFVRTPTGLALENVPVPAPEHYAAWWRPRLANYLEMARDAWVERSGETKREALAITEAIVRTMAQELGAQGIPLFLVHLPHPADLGGAGPYSWKWLTRLCERDAEIGFTCVPTVPRFRELLTTQALVDEHFRCHFSPLLYGETGRSAAAALAERAPDRFRFRASGSSPERDRDERPIR